MKTIFRTMSVAAAVVLAVGCGNSKGNKAEVAVVETDPTVAVTQVSVREVPQALRRSRAPCLSCVLLRFSCYH